ncbi:hypothetical protein [Chryseobacterium sp. ZHDP1]|uniref:hypothetical protein n=1 Tax=Chryseobacterium sp. ZHDP1 TaxID=2838877 RepID=UPI001BDFFD8E|nr:hypothetical protein [Chryseobacterium sp. ZHDP1]QWA38888.1 hypothetical protein KKI44_01365 [Chryseobacterium sp. ZHDP1]
MSNTTQLAITGRNSKVIAKKRRSRKLITPAAFAKLFNGSFEMNFKNGIGYCKFISSDKMAQAWGINIQKAYRNTLRNFHQKYTT